jgi:hypothetical protein
VHERSVGESDHDRPKLSSDSRNVTGLTGFWWFFHVSRSILAQLVQNPKVSITVQKQIVRAPATSIIKRRVGKESPFSPTQWEQQA